MQSCWSISWWLWSCDCLVQPLKDDENLPFISPQEGDEEEAKEGTEIKILTPNELITRLWVLLAQIKSGNNLWKLKTILKKSD